MIFSAWTGRDAVLLASALAATLAVTGCGPMSQGGGDEQRETHFVTGRARLQARDFPGALESFERALEVNPRNAAAHFELALLLADPERSKDWAGAIHHFERYLRHTKDGAQSHTASNQIAACKQSLASGADFGQLAQGVNNKLSVLAAEKLRLEQRVTQLEELLAQKNAVALPPAGSTRNQSPATGLNPSGAAPAAPRTNATVAAPATRTRTHSVAAGETPTAIAKRYGVKLDKLMAANPGLDASRMKVGQKINVPAP